MIIELLSFPILEGQSISHHGAMGCLSATGATILGFAVYNGNLKVPNNFYFIGTAFFKHANYRISEH